MRAGRNALRVARSRGGEGNCTPAVARTARFEDGHLTIAGAGKDDRWLLAILRAASQASCGKLCAGFAYNHSVQQPLAKTAAGKITKPHCGFVRHFVAKFGFIRLTRWRFGLTNGNTLVYQHHGVEAEAGKD